MTQMTQMTMATGASLQFKTVTQMTQMTQWLRGRLAPACSMQHAAQWLRGRRRRPHYGKTLLAEGVGQGRRHRANKNVPFANNFFLPAISKMANCF